MRWEELVSDVRKKRNAHKNLVVKIEEKESTLKT